MTEFYTTESIAECLENSVFVKECISACESGNSEYEYMNNIPKEECRNAVYDVAGIN